MKKIILLYLILSTSFVNAQLLTGASYSSYSITCAIPQITISALGTFSAPINYTWASLSFSATGPTVVVTNPGMYTLTAQSGTLVNTLVCPIQINTTVPVSSASSTFVVISTTTAPAFTFTAISPTTNITHYVYTPVGGTYVATGASIVYYPAGPGTYTHCIEDDVNGCVSCQPFVVSVGSTGTFTETVGIAEERAEQDLLFPNPNRGLFTITLKNNSTARVEIYNSLGSLVKVQDLEKDGNTLDIGQELSGIYVVRIIAKGDKVRYLKIVKE